VGPVVIHAGASVQGNTTIIGPTLIGAGARIGAGAIVAHSLVGSDCSVPPGTVVRDRVWFDGQDGRLPDRQRPIATYGERLSRLAVESPDRTSIETATPSRQRHLKLKRAVDVVASAAGLILLSPLFLLVSIAIWLESRGPIFYGGEREGVKGRIFKCWKFRTMKTGADAVQHQLKNLDKMDGPHFKLDRDPRVTLVGHLLRVTNVDELPQLWNVLIGQMSLVGPRPSPFRENQICIPWREGRLSVRPGMTGLWQVCRQDRSSGDFHQWIEYDLLYVQNMSALLDFKILVATFFTAGGKIPVPALWMVGRDTHSPRLWITSPALEDGLFDADVALPAAPVGVETGDETAKAVAAGEGTPSQSSRYQASA